MYENDMQINDRPNELSPQPPQVLKEEKVILNDQENMQENSNNIETPDRILLEARDEGSFISNNQDSNENANGRSRRSSRKRMNPKIYRDEYVTNITGKRRHPNQDQEKKLQDSLLASNCILNKNLDGIENQDINEINLTNSKTNQPQAKIKDDEFCKPYKRDTKKKEWTYDEVCDLTNQFMSFEWDNKDVQRYNLSQKLTSSIFWHYVSNQYFPLKTFDYAQNMHEHFDNEIREKLCNKEISQKEMLSLYNIDNFDERIKMCKEKFMTEQLLQTSVLPIINDQQSPPVLEQKNIPDETKSKDDANNIDCMISFCERYLDKIRNKNSGVVSELSDKLKTAYDPTLRREFESKINQEWKETKVMPEGLKNWNLHDIHDLNNSIYFDIASAYLDDCQENLNYYLSDHTNILVDSWYCTKNEENYLHYVANKHQERNEVNTKKLLQRITEVQEKLQKDSQADSNKVVMAHPLTASLLNERRQKEEDAKCSICGSGDYEENDLIVFCGFCGIAVHQCCYGVEELPDGEWFCISCFVFGKRKGRNLKCMLCSKSGGAMKPTNVLTNDEFLSNRFDILISNNEENKCKKYGGSNSRIFKSEKKNATLASIINYEHNNLSFIQSETNANNDENENEAQVNFYDHMDENLNYKFEKDHQIETKYAWAHMSCANFIPEIEYTPKSPLKVGRLQYERFIHACIICCEKKGAAIKCSQEDCDIWMHGECARRAGYYMECGRVEINEGEVNNEGDNVNSSSKKSSNNSCKSKTESTKHKGIKSICKNKNLLKIFCERHRPLKIIKEIKDKFESATEELQKFCKTMKKALDVMSRIPYKCKKVANDKKWKEKDKKVLLDRVRERFVLLRKLRINVTKIDPNKRRKRRGGSHSKYSYSSKRRKINDSTDLKIVNEMNSVDNESSVISSYAASKAGEQKEVYYKLATPCFPPEPDWSITLSRNDFPWYDVKFEEYSAQECFDMYRTLITDEDSFNK